MESLGNPRPKLADALANADLLVDRATIDRTIAQMAAPIARDYAGEVPVYLTIMHGALPFAGQLALELGARGLDLEFDYLHATRYRGETTGGELVWKHRPATALYGRRVLLVDDILATGGTLRAGQHLLDELGLQLAGTAVLMELVELQGRAVCGPVHSVFRV